MEIALYAHHTKKKRENNNRCPCFLIPDKEPLQRKLPGKRPHDYDLHALIPGKLYVLNNGCTLDLLFHEVSFVLTPRHYAILSF